VNSGILRLIAFLNSQYFMQWCIDRASFHVRGRAGTTRPVNTNIVFSENIYWHLSSSLFLPNVYSWRLKQKRSCSINVFSDTALHLLRTISQKPLTGAELSSRCSVHELLLGAATFILPCAQNDRVPIPIFLLPPCPDMLWAHPLSRVKTAYSLHQSKQTSTRRLIQKLIGAVYL
jgi:hypothetical protein